MLTPHGFWYKIELPVYVCVYVDNRK